MNLLSGIITIDSKRYPLLWTGMIAAKVCDHYKSNKSHALDHVQIQQHAVRCKWIRVSGKRYKGDVKLDDTYSALIIIILHPQFAEIRSGYIVHSKNIVTTKKSTLSGTAKKRNNEKLKIFEFTEDQIASLAEEGLTPEQVNAAFIKQQKAAARKKKK
ncbi:MAG TPA: hypothetical protein PKD90_05675 [Phnomibacter sp.]|nr:hypothetical protein [Lacibacter sp.]HMO89545.1 hypothetical protein [Lacibacter sp.]HMP92340.1 hypothetical protein [Phnomibacter sp.]